MKPCCDQHLFVTCLTHFFYIDNTGCDIVFFCIFSCKICALQYRLKRTLSWQEADSCRKLHSSSGITFLQLCLKLFISFLNAPPDLLLALSLGQYKEIIRVHTACCHYFFAFQQPGKFFQDTVSHLCAEIFVDIRKVIDIHHGQCISILLWIFLCLKKLYQFCPESFQII